MISTGTRNNILIATLGIALTIAISKYYHYNYIANTRGQARTLQLTGLRDFVCKGKPYVVGNIDQCDNRSIYMDPDWGVTAYFTIYGIETKEEAESLAAFMLDARTKSNQNNIPINLEVYSSPRSKANRPAEFKILDRDL